MKQHLPPRNIGDQVFDIPSQSIRTIRSYIDYRRCWKYMGLSAPSLFYLVDAPPDPTGDGAFSDGWRNDFEVCDPDKTLPLHY